MRNCNKTYTYYNKYAALPLVPLAWAGARWAGGHALRWAAKKAIPTAGRWAANALGRGAAKKAIPTAGRVLKKVSGLDTTAGKVWGGINAGTNLISAHSDGTLYEKGGFRKVLADTAFSTAIMGNSTRIFRGAGNLGRRALGKPIPGKTLALPDKNMPKPSLFKRMKDGTPETIGTLGLEMGADIPYQHYMSDTTNRLYDAAERTKNFKDYYINNPSVNTRTLHRESAFYK